MNRGWEILRELDGRDRVSITFLSCCRAISFPPHRAICLGYLLRDYTISVSPCHKSQGGVLGWFSCWPWLPKVSTGEIVQIPLSRSSLFLELPGDSGIPPTIPLSRSWTALGNATKKDEVDTQEPIPLSDKQRRFLDTSKNPPKKNRCYKRCLWASNPLALGYRGPKICPAGRWNMEVAWLRCWTE